MSTPPAVIPAADWLSCPAVARTFILTQHQQSEALRSQRTGLASELANQREQIGRSSRNSSKSPFRDGPGFRVLERRKASGRKRGGQPGHPGSIPGPSWRSRESSPPTTLPKEPCGHLSCSARTVSHRIQWANGAICGAHVVTDTPTLRPQERDVWDVLEQVWIAHQRGVSSDIRSWR